ncbi:hypothetical protein HAX54_051653 [Datura stramonium]|uniref:Uncharacterized protein n=1 Tax=Datura stramonium TaxID=4076 RepID=A0ABS8SXW8_DATST|nr:hypothetical protein [Datura stramonium]
MGTMQIDELIGNLQTNELKKIDQIKKELKKERSLVLKATKDDSDSNDEDMTMFVCREEQKKKCTNSKKQQKIASKAFKKAMKARWGETSDEDLGNESRDNELRIRVTPSLMINLLR